MLQSTFGIRAQYGNPVLTFANFLPTKDLFIGVYESKEGVWERGYLFDLRFGISFVRDPVHKIHFECIVEYPVEWTPHGCFIGVPLSIWTKLISC